MNKVYILTCNCALENILNNMFSNEIKIEFDTNEKDVYDVYKKALDDGYNILLNHFINKDIFEFICYKLKKEGYVFRYYDLNNLKYNIAKSIGNINLFKYIKCIILLKIYNYVMYKTQLYIRSNIGYEINKGNFKRIENGINNIFKENNIFKIIKKYIHYNNRLKQISIDKPKRCNNVLILSENYIPNRLYYDYFIEDILSKYNINEKRFIDYNYKLNFLKEKYYLFKIKKYCKYNIGYKNIRNIYRLIKHKDYDGIVLLYSPKMMDSGLLLMVKNICLKLDICFIKISFDNNINESFLNSELERLNKLINLKKNTKNTLQN